MAGEGGVCMVYEKRITELGFFESRSLVRWDFILWFVILRSFDWGPLLAQSFHLFFFGDRHRYMFVGILF